MTAIAYRPHIDGLRGVAIIAVVLYHAKLFNVTGGYIGVDVFFVISGFLITTIIIRDIEIGTFSLIGFWERRIRRIIPALFVVIMCASVVASVLVLYPTDYHTFGEAVVAQSIFTSNVFFMTSDNYFDQPSQYSPLLHTWTLSVEEQFYLIFPLIVLLCIWLSSKYLGSTPKREIAIPPLSRNWPLIFSVVALGLASLFFSVWLVDVRPAFPFSIPFVPQKIFGSASYATAGFYLLPARVWELAIGIVVALSMIKIRSMIFAEIVSISGIAAIVVSTFLFNDATTFPGIAALLPTLATAAVIIANENHSNKSGRLLSFPLLVWVGLISYSLYLWHWPLFVFARLESINPLSGISMIGLIILSTFIAWLSYRFIEMPIRHKRFISSRLVVFICGFVALAMMTFFGYLIERATSPLFGNIPPAVLQITQLQNDMTSRIGMCFQSAGDVAQYTGLCRIGNIKPSKPDFVLWGDSHADADVPLFVALGWTYGAQGLVFALGDCPPLLEVGEIPPVSVCESENSLARQYITDHDVKNIFLVARWSYYVTGGRGRAQFAFLSYPQTVSTSSQASVIVFQKSLTLMVQQMVNEGRNVYIVKQAPEQFNFDPRTAFYKAVHGAQSIEEESTPTAENVAYQTLANGIIDTVGKISGVHVLDPASILCAKNSVCDLERNGQLLYRDENHLSTAGVMTLEPLFEPVFESIQR
jgi:peptidoglycan/LPS O-acetylase OafA/YrhL